METREKPSGDPPGRRARREPLTNSTNLTSKKLSSND